MPCSKRMTVKVARKIAYAKIGSYPKEMYNNALKVLRANFLRHWGKKK